MLIVAIDMDVIPLISGKIALFRNSNEFETPHCIWNDSFYASIQK